MQLSTFAITALAIIGASAVPTAWQNTPPPSNNGGSSTCPSNTNQYCCDGGFLGLGCTLSNILGSDCSAQTVCCTDNGGDQTCTNSDGTIITIPITILKLKSSS